MGKGHRHEIPLQHLVLVSRAGVNGVRAADVVLT